MATRQTAVPDARPVVGRATGLRARPLVLTGLLLGALGVALVLGVAMGSVAVAPGDTIAIRGAPVWDRPRATVSQ
jgi:hypothetical protein